MLYNVYELNKFGTIGAFLCAKKKVQPNTLIFVFAERERSPGLQAELKRLHKKKTPS